MSGRQAPEPLGRIHLWTFLEGVNVESFPMHVLDAPGLASAPSSRRSPSC